MAYFFGTCCVFLWNCDLFIELLHNMVWMSEFSLWEALLISRLPIFNKLCKDRCSFISILLSCNLLPPPDFVCLFACLCVSKITQSYGWIFLKFWGYVGSGTSYQWFNFGGDPERILDSVSLWNFRYHCFQWGIRETALPPSKQHCLGGGVQALTAFEYW